MKIKLASMSEGTRGGDVGADVSPVKIEVGRVGEGRQRDRLLAHLLAGTVASYPPMAQRLYGVGVSLESSGQILGL